MNARCPCGDHRCLLWMPRPPEPRPLRGQVWCAECHGQAVVLHQQRARRQRKGDLRKRLEAA